MELFDQQWKNSIFDGEEDYPGALAYFSANEVDWERIQKLLAYEYEPWDISEGDYWIYVKFEYFKDEAAKSMLEMLQRISRDVTITTI